jgi:hypothetical protein
LGFFGGLLLSTAWIAVFAATIGGFFNARGGSQIAEPFAGWKPAVPK